MRRIGLVVVAIQIALTQTAPAEDATDSITALSNVLPLFEKNHCGVFKDPAEQLFCGDPELNVASAKLNTAIQERLNRLANRRLAIEENAEWIRDRNSSCAIVAKQNVPVQNIKSVQGCLLKETEERIEILTDPNFDCLAANTTAGMLICSDPALATAKAELNARVLGLVAKLNGEDGRNALAEYERWSRERDRKCGLVGKDNVPLDELSSSADCLTQYMSKEIEDIIAAKGDAKKVFGRRLASASPDADAVDLCVAQIHSTNACENFLTVSRVFQIDNEVGEQAALVTAEVEMFVLSPFAVCSPVASSCTGTCWDPNTGKPNPSPGTKESFTVSHRLQIEKTFAFRKTDTGWRCDTSSLQPVEYGLALSGP
jgi:uncharacterized protein YecT (DUF1311 family)